MCLARWNHGRLRLQVRLRGGVPSSRNDMCNKIIKVDRRTGIYRSNLSVKQWPVPCHASISFFVAVFFQSYAPPLDQQPQRSVDFYLEFVLGLKILAQQQLELLLYYRRSC